MSISTTLRSISRPAAQGHNAPARGLVSRLIGWHGLWQQRRRLLTLSNAQLDDIGLSEADIAREARRPFWDAPQHWRQ